MQGRPTQFWLVPDIDGAELFRSLNIQPEAAPSFAAARPDPILARVERLGIKLGLDRE
jgi:hypothetical protein